MYLSLLSHFLNETQQVLVHQPYCAELVLIRNSAYLHLAHLISHDELQLMRV